MFLKLTVSRLFVLVVLEIQQNNEIFSIVKRKRRIFTIPRTLTKNHFYCINDRHQVIYLHLSLYTESKIGMI